LAGDAGPLGYASAHRFKHARKVAPGVSAAVGIRSLVESVASSESPRRRSRRWLTAPATAQVAAGAREARGTHKSRGQSLVEFALILPVLMVLFATTLDLGRLAMSQLSVSNAAREGAFQASTTPASFDNTKGCPVDGKSNLVVCRVLLEAKGSGVTIAPGDIALTCAPSGCATGLGNRVTVSVVGHFQLLTPMLAGFFGGSQSITFKKSSTSQIETLPAPPVGYTAPTPTPSASPSAAPTPTPMPACTIPSAGFTFSTSPTSNQKPVTMTVVDTTTSPNCAITSWFWDWNDGSTSMLQNPGSHTYLAEGTYEITLKVTNAAGSNTTGSVQVKVKK
jgi:hypothetical protein